MNPPVWIYMALPIHPPSAQFDLQVRRTTVWIFECSVHSSTLCTIRSKFPSDRDTNVMVILVVQPC